MNTALTLFENKRVCNYMKSQFKTIRKSKIDPEIVLTQLIETYKDRYCFTRISTVEISIKIDKKKNGKQLESEIRDHLVAIVNESSVNINFLFKIIKNNNELIVRAKRYNG